MNGVTLRDRAAFLESARTLVVADVHVGRDEASAVAFPLGEREDLRERLDALLAHFDPETVVFAGDVVHTFDGVSERSRASLADLAAACRAAGAELVLVAGNHDTALSAAWDGPIHDEYVVEGSSTAARSRTVVCHGHEPPSAVAGRYLVGHVHPTVQIEGDRHPCFLYGEGTFRDADVLLLPAFNRLAPGVVINDLPADEFDSPFVDDPDRLCPLVYDSATQETLTFPPLGEFRHRL